MRSRQWEWVKLYINVKRQIEIIFNATGQMRSASGSDRWQNLTASQQMMVALKIGGLEVGLY